MKKKLLALAQFAVGLLLLGFIFWKLQSSGEIGKFTLALQQAAGNWPLLLFGAAWVGVCIFLCVQRWNLILRAQGFILPFRRLFALCFVGQFFNSFMLGSTGGDLVKAYYVAAETHHRKAEVVSTVFIDRIMGLIGLMILTGIVMACRLPFFLSTAPTRVALVINLAQLTGSVAGIIAVARKNVLEKSALFRHLEQRTSLGQLLTRVHGVFQFCLRDPALLVKTTLLSIVNHVAFLVCIFYLAMALDIRMGFLDCLTVFPVINTVSAMPVTLNGLGTREGMCIYLLGIFGVSPAKAVTLSLFIYGSVLVWSVFGGMVYFFYIYLRGRTAPREEG
jgi:uncharacterized protein (TIRG00374 family)